MPGSQFRIATLRSAATAVTALALAGCAAYGGDEQTQANAGEPVGFAQLCSADSINAVASSIQASDVRPGKIANQPGPFLTDGVQYTPAKDGLPAYCQVTGSYVTNPETGKTANFLATFPENWNGKYLQLGCGGHCGTFAVSNPAMFTITITNQGKPGDIIRKGYAAFATDQGHTENTHGSWAIEGPGKVNEDAIEDLYVRASRVLTKVGKEFTRKFYAAESGRNRDLARAYFSGCSGGGRDALVAASYFPEEFDGIVAGSPYNLMGASIQLAGTPLATVRSPDANVSSKQVELVSKTVTRQCDALDGVRDGLIQNPAACNFAPERDLPRCGPGKTGDDCFTQAQVETVSATLTAITDEYGKVVQPGFSASNYSIKFPPAPSDPDADEPWSTNDPTSYWPLGNASIKTFTYKNDPNFATRSIMSYRSGGAGPIKDFRIVVPRSAVNRMMDEGRPGTGHYPENLAKFIGQDRKLLIWHNLSDEALTPYMSFNLYKELAARHGGFASLQDNVRLFSLPGTGHCSGGISVGPGSFDALEALENWVEDDAPPNSLNASLYGTLPMGFQDFSKPLGRTMPLCMFPQMARYKGTGDVNDAANWTCPAGDKRMLQVGESGKRAGVMQ